MIARFMLAAVAAIVSASSLASPAATQAWVRRYVATNGVTRTATKEVASTMCIDGTNVTFRMAVELASEPAWRIISSSVTGMPVGVCFALGDDGNAHNRTNTACTVISTSVSTNWVRVTGGVTNSISVARLDFTVGGVVFRGYEDTRSGEVTAAGLFDLTGVIVFKRTYVTKFERSRLIPVATAKTPSLWGLLFGSAYADWVQDGVWELDTSVDPNPLIEEGSGGETTYTYYWASHYRWDGMNGTISVPSLVADFHGGQSYVFELNYVDDSLVAVGGDYCTAMPEESRAKMSEMIRDDVLDCAEESMAGNEKVLAVFRLFRSAKSFDSQIAECIRGVIDAIYVDLSCPLTKTTVQTEEEPIQPEEEFPLPPDPQCSHLNVIVSSSQAECSFSCATCRKVMASGEHSFVDTTTHCAVCDNSYRNITCGFRSLLRADHIFEDASGEAYGGTDVGCKCRHNGIWHPHPSLSAVTTEWKRDDDVHWHEQKCSVCDWQGGKTDIGQHVPRTTVRFVNDAGHLSSNVCSICTEFMSAKVEAHAPDAAMGVRYENSSNEMHRVIKKCSQSPVGCGCEYVSGEEPHYVGADPRTETISDGAAGHHTNFFCIATGCTGFYSNATVQHTFETWKTSDSWLVDDTMSCGCGFSTNVGHQVAFAEIVHWCANGGTHLMGVHTWAASDTNRCSTCGFRRNATSDLAQSVVKYSACGSCYIERTRFRASVESEWGPWLVSKTSCAYGWDSISDGCGCPDCRSGHPGWCWCEHGRQPKWIAKLTDEFVSSGALYHLRWAGSAAIREVNGDDPVLEVGDDALARAFTNCVNLESVSFAYCTNVGNRAFKMAFNNDPKLRTVSFPALANAGEEAFYYCQSMRDARFPVLTNVAALTFVGCGLTNFSLPAARNIGQLALWECGELGELSITSATSVAHNALENCSSLSNVACSSVTRAYVVSNEYFHVSRSGCVFHCSDGDVAKP